MPDLPQLAAALETVPTRPVKGILVRIVPFASLAKYNPPNWLFASGKPNRYNPIGTNCVYFSESETVANCEHDAQWQNTPGTLQAKVTYYADVDLRAVVDLADASALKTLGLKLKDLLKPWRLAAQPTPTQLLGLAASGHHRISGIRYPSKAAFDTGQNGFNLVIFPKNISAPDFVHILGPDKQKPLQSWP